MPLRQLTPQNGCSLAFLVPRRRAASRAAVASALSGWVAPHTPHPLGAVSFVSYVLILSSQSFMGSFLCACSPAADALGGYTHRKPPSFRPRILRYENMYMFYNIVFKHAHTPQKKR